MNVLSGKRREYGELDRDRMKSQIAVQGEVQGVQMLHGAGTTNPSKLFWELLGLVQARAKFAVHATYRAVGSSTGQKEFLGASNGNKALNHFGSGDIPMTAERYSAVVDAGRTMVHVPFALGGIGVFHSAPVGGASVHLTACVLAKIFSVQITTWDDPEIEALNPDVALPTLPIKVVHRVKGSSSTAGFVEYLEATCPASWSLGTGSSLDTWPASTAGAQGSGGMSQYIEENAGAIGYVDAGHGHERGLSEVALRNMDGVYLTTNEADIGAAATVALDQGGLIPLNATADWSAVNLYNLAGPTTYPITMISYFYLEQDLSGMDAQTAALLLAFVQFVLSDEGQAKAEENLFVKLPQELQDYNAATLASLVLPAGYTPLTFELASATQIEVGAGMNVLSGKRREYGELDRDRMESQIEELELTPGSNKDMLARISQQDSTISQQNSTIIDLQAAMSTMQATLDRMQAVDNLPAPPSPPPLDEQLSKLKNGLDNKDHNDHDESTLSIAALVFGLLALVLSIVALVMIALNKSTAKPVQREISFSRNAGEKPEIQCSATASSSATQAANSAV